MKLQLDNKTLNAYINEALRQELNENNMDELFGSRNRKKNIRAITGQGWGNQNRDTKNFWGAANSDISNTDAESEAPQTLVGIVTKLENNLMKLEKFVGLPGTFENLGAGVVQSKNNGKTSVKNSLLAAINALIRIDARLGEVEKLSQTNTIMEEFDAGSFAGGAAAGVGGALLAKPALNATKTVGGAIKSGVGKIFGKKGATGGWTTVTNQATKTGLGKTLRGVGKWAGSSVIKTTGGEALGGVAGALTTPAAIAVAAFAIAQAAATIATKGRSRNIVRTYNCAAVLAKRMGNAAKALEAKLGGEQGQMQQSQQAGTQDDQINELNVRRASQSFASIEQNMQQLSSIMQNLESKLKNGGMQGQLPQSLGTPQEIKQFQQWANANDYKDRMGRELVVDGKWGPNTEYVYNQIAQKNQQQQVTEGKQKINEANGIENALRTLEKNVSVTGTGAPAYADISALSGGQGQGSSRLQNGQNAKAIMRTYPPVLNDYLNKLQTMGINTGNLMPLRDDPRPHRNYSVKEIQDIDRRIKELLNIAQNTDGTVPKQNGPVKLPPKPVIPKKPAASKEPEQTQEEPELPRDTGKQLPQMDSSALLNNPEAVAKSNRGDTMELPMPKLTPPQSAAQTMAQLAGSDLPDRRARIRDTASNMLNASNLDLSRSERQAVRDARKSAIQATRQPHKPLSEQQFKNIVKEIIKETLNK